MMLNKLVNIICIIDIFFFFFAFDCPADIPGLFIFRQILSNFFSYIMFSLALYMDSFCQHLLDLFPLKKKTLTFQNFIISEIHVW